MKKVSSAWFLEKQSHFVSESKVADGNLELSPAVSVSLQYLPTFACEANSYLVFWSQWLGWRQTVLIVQKNSLTHAEINPHTCTHTDLVLSAETYPTMCTMRMM